MENRKRVTEAIVHITGIDDDEITPEASLRDDLGFDSLDTIECVMELEKEFQISIPDDKLDDVKTIQDVYNLLKELGVDIEEDKS